MHGRASGLSLALLLALAGCEGKDDRDHPRGLEGDGPDVVDPRPFPPQVRPGLPGPVAGLPPFVGAGGAGGSGGEGGFAGAPPREVSEHVRIWTRTEGVPGRIVSVSVDRGGNVWAAERLAGGTGRLRLLRRGAEIWETFGAADGLSDWPVTSVAGGRDGEVWVGYEGLFPDANVFDDPPEIAKSGDVDRIRLTDEGLERLHHDISSPPDDAYPDGRDALRTCFRIVPVLDGPYEGDVWFGCNHGMAMYSARFDRVLEHRHTAINRGSTLYSGDFRGLALAPDGDVWIGGAHRGGRIRYAGSGDFWAPIDPEVDVFPDGVALDDEGDDWTMAMVVEPDGVLWAGGFGNGLARRAADGSWSYLTSADGLPDDRVTDLALDEDGSLWVACGRSAARVDGGRVVQELHNMNAAPGTVLAVAVDRTSSPRRVIVGTGQGIAIYDGP